MIDVHMTWIAQYGYPAIFGLLMLGIVGLPVPDETLLIFAGYLVATGALSSVPTLLTAFLGSVCGITISYAAGRSLGPYVVERFGRWLHIDARQMEWVRRWYERQGKYVLIAGYFVPGVRHVTAYLAGSSQLSWRTFVLFAFSGALLWSAGFITLGYFLGEEWRRMALLLHDGLIGVSVLILMLLGYKVMRWRRGLSAREGENV